MDTASRSDGTAQNRCTVIGNGSAEQRDVALAREVGVTLLLNGAPIVEIQCLPTGLEEMALGFFVAEGLIRDPAELVAVEADAAGRRVEVSARIPAERTADLGGRMKVTSGCGRGVTIDNVEEVMDCGRPFNLAFTMTATRIMALGAAFNRRLGLYQETRGVHSAALSDGERILHFAEDVGRHNAVDKVVGMAFREGRNLAALALLCSGRFSFDMVAKAVRVRIPLVVTPAAATHEAVELARRFHQTLCGRVRRNSMVVYSCPWRVTGLLAR